MPSKTKTSKNAPKSARKSPSTETAPKLLSGGNPQIAKGDGDAIVQAYIVAMPGWKQDVGRRLDALVVRTVPGVRKAVRWITPFYGVAGEGWFLAFHCIAKYIKVTFFRGTALRPVPPVESKMKDVRYFHIHEDDEFDERLLASWIRQASELPGERCFESDGDSGASGARPSSPAPRGSAKSPARKSPAVHTDTKKYNSAQAPADRAICERLAELIASGLPEAENKVWHAHPVWFLDGNPIVGYSKLKNCVRLLFWSGQSFSEPGLTEEGTFKAADARYTAVDQVDAAKLKRWLAEAREIQWDYKNLIRRKGRLERLK